MKRAIYAGSFDPPTNGHLWMVAQGVQLFDELIVAIGVNPAKVYTFSLADRLSMLEKSVGTYPHTRIDSYHNQFLVHYAQSVQASYILRGIRNEGDYQNERGLRHINHDLRADITTIFLMPPREIAEVSSSLVKGLVGPAGWEDVVRKYVPPAVFEVFQTKYQ
jgi:pantetheine-phosphate adenylyltransferase